MQMLHAEVDVPQKGLLSVLVRPNPRLAWTLISFPLVALIRCSREVGMSRASDNSLLLHCTLLASSNRR